MANSCVLQKCVIVNSPNAGKRSGLKKIPFVPPFSPLPVKFTAPPRSPGCHNSNPHLTLPSHHFSHKNYSRGGVILPPGQEQQCCSGNFRASPPVAFTPTPPQPPFIPFPFPDSPPEPKCHTTLHSRCARGAHTC